MASSDTGELLPDCGSNHVHLNVTSENVEFDVCEYMLAEYMFTRSNASLHLTFNVSNHANHTGIKFIIDVGGKYVSFPPRCWIMSVYGTFSEGSTFI